MSYSTSKHDLNQPSLERSPPGALKSGLGKDGGADPRTSFYNKFKEEVAEHDNDLQKKHDEDLNTTLIFSGLFSAVTSAFIIAIQSELKPDYEEMNNTLLELLLNVTVGIIPPGQPVSPPRWTGPNPAVRQAQATLYVTLCAALFAAFLATLGKQWLNRYGQTDTHGSIQDRCRDRERKLSGIDRWWFHRVMQFAPLVIQGSLGLLGAALSRYLWEVDRMVSSVVIGFTSFGCVLYIAIVTVSVFSFDCPFQTPVSLLAHSTIDTIKLWWENHHRQAAPNLAGLAEVGMVAAALPGLHQQVLQTVLSRSWEKGYRFDARCITRMLVMSTDVDTIRLTMEFVQEVVWDSRIKTIPLEWICRKLIGCFDFTHPQTPILLPTLRDVAYLSAKALAHIQFQQPCIPEHGGSALRGDNRCTDTQYTPLGSLGSNSDPDLESALLMVDKAFGRNVKIPWNEYRLSPAHHLWVSHQFVYYASLNPRSEDALAFVKYSLDPDKSPSDAVIADCLYIISMIFEPRCRIDDLTKRDKSFQMNDMIDSIFLELSNRFQGPYPTNADASELPLRVLKLTTRLSTTAVATKSYELFGTIMQSRVAEEKKMEAARLTLDAAYRQKLEFPPPVRDPKPILDFLLYHVRTPVRNRRHNYAISSAMRAIDSTSGNPTSQSWTWRIEDAGELLTEFQEPLHPEGFEWWYRVLWIHYGGLDSDVRSRLDEIATDGDDRVDLKRCRIAVENEIERVKDLDRTANTEALEDAYNRLTAFVEKSRLQASPVAWPPDIHVVRDYRRHRPSFSTVH